MQPQNVGLFHQSQGFTSTIYFVLSSLPRNKNPLFEILGSIFKRPIWLSLYILRKMDIIETMIRRNRHKTLYKQKNELLKCFQFVCMIRSGFYAAQRIYFKLCDCNEKLNEFSNKTKNLNI